MRKTLFDGERKDLHGDMLRLGVERRVENLHEVALDDRRAHADKERARKSEPAQRTPKREHLPRFGKSLGVTNQFGHVNVRIFV